MPSCPLSPFLTGKTNPKIRAVEQRRAWHRTKERPVKALTGAPKNHLGNAHFSTQDSLEQGTL